MARCNTSPSSSGLVPKKRRESVAIQSATAAREFIKSDQFDVVYVVAFSVHLAMTAYGANGRSKHRLRRCGVLRDRNDLKLLTGCTDYISNSFAHQKPRYRRYEGNRTGLGVRFVLSHNTIVLYAPIVAPEGHRAPKGNSVS